YGRQLQALPSVRSLLEAACELLGLRLEWQPRLPDADEGLVVPLLGCSPSDQTVTVVELAVQGGMSVKAGQLLACGEAGKAVAEIDSPADGVVAAVHVTVGEQAPVGAPLLRLAGSPAQAARKAVAEPLPRITPRAVGRAQPAARSAVQITGLASARGR